MSEICYHHPWVACMNVHVQCWLVGLEAIVFSMGVGCVDTLVLVNSAEALEQQHIALPLQLTKNEGEKIKGKRAHTAEYQTKMK